MPSWGLWAWIAGMAAFLGLITLFIHGGIIDKRREDDIKRKAAGV